MQKFTLEPIRDMEVWRKLLLGSPQATRFLDPDFLALFEVQPRLYGVFRKGVCVLGLPVIDPRSQGSTALPWCYKQGPVFHHEVARSAQAKRVQYEIELSELGVSELARTEPWFRFALHESLIDVRGFDWVHYHDPSKPRCTILPRYTALVDLRGAGQDDLRRNVRSARRQEEGYALRRENLVTTQDGSIEELFGLYCATFASQGLDISAMERTYFAPYIQYFLDAGVGQFLTVRDEAGQALASTFIFQDYDNIWHVPIVGTGDTRYGGTLLYFHILNFVIGRGGAAVDFDGANSPNRAYFKHSMGAKPQLYFDIRYGA